MTRVAAVAGQEVYYLSHSVHFTRRCLYVLTWTPPQPASDAGALSPPLTLEQLKADLRLWLQMLAQHVPNAKVLLVGTRDDGSAEYQGVRAHVEAAVDAEIEQLNLRVKSDNDELLQMEEECNGAVVAAKNDWTKSGVSKRFQVSDSGESDVNEEHKEIMWWLDQCRVDSGLEEWQQRIAKKVANGMQRAQMLRERRTLMEGGRAQLHRVAESFTLDCLSGTGVLKLQQQLSGICNSHVFGMGEPLPKWWQVVLDALQEGGTSAPMRKADAIQRVRQAVPALISSEVWAALQFWADLGRIFVYGDFVLPNPRLLVDLIKPLLHHDPPFLLDDACSQEDKDLLLPSCCERSVRILCSGYLRLLKFQAVLDKRLLPLLKSWGQDHSFHETMLNFLEECHLICLTGTAPDASSEILITARSRDLPPLHAQYPTAAAGLSAGDQREHDIQRSNHAEVCSRFNGMLESTHSCRVLFVVSRYHIGVISRLQAFIHSARPREVSVAFNAAKDSLFMRRVTPHVESSSQSCCAVRVLPFCDNEDASNVLSAFMKADGPMSKEGDRRSRCGIIIAANDLALLAFMVRRVEKTLKRWSVCADCQCFVEGLPDVCPFIRFDSPASSDACVLPLSAVLLGNAWQEVVEGVQMRDIFPRQRRCAMFLSYASVVRENTGTRYACETIRKGFQKAAMCNVWMDCVDTSESRSEKPLIRQGLQTANVYIVCLTPLYLTQPNCLAELNDILTLVEKLGENKCLIIIPLHPAMTAHGRKFVIQSRCVLVPDFLQPSKIRRHLLGVEAIKLLERLAKCNFIQSDDRHLDSEPWYSSVRDEHLKMQPNVRWNGAKATRVMCRDVIKNIGAKSLSRLLVCATEEPLKDVDFPKDNWYVSTPPSLQHLDFEADISSLVVSIKGFDPIFRLFSDQNAISLLERGVPEEILCGLVYGSQKLKNLPRYLQNILLKVDYKTARNAFEGIENLGALLNWAEAPLAPPATRRVVCRVEGSDDVLLLHALFKLKLPSLQRQPGFCKEFSYGRFISELKTAELKIRDRQVLVEKKEFNVGALETIRNLQGKAKLNNAQENPDFELCWLNLDDQDLTVFDTRPKNPDNKQLVCSFSWRWGRAIENYLLPATAPAALYLSDHASVPKLTLEVFITIARHFFPAKHLSELDSGKLCGHEDLKWNDLIGVGWKNWSKTMHSSNVSKIPNSFIKNEAEGLRNFAMDVLGVAALLAKKHENVYGSKGSRADEWLLHLISVHKKVSKGDFDQTSKGKAESVNWVMASVAMLDLPANPTVPLTYFEPDDAAPWFNFPGVCSFLANLCSCQSKHFGGNDRPVKAAAASALRLVQHALCVLLLGCDPASPAPQCTLLASAECSCFLPHVVVGHGKGKEQNNGETGQRKTRDVVPGNSGGGGMGGKTPHVVGPAASATASEKKERKNHLRIIDHHLASAQCFTCGRAASLHALPPRDPSGAVADDFLVELCRLGSVGWQSHAFMDAVYGRGHLGVEFDEQHINDSHLLYEQHLRLLLFGGTAESERCRDLTVSKLPDITVFTIIGGKVKDGKLEPLVERRRAEFDSLCHQISILIGDFSYSASSVSTAPSVSAGQPVRAAAAGGGGASIPSSKASGASVAPPASKSLSPVHSAAVALSASPSVEAVRGKEKKSKVKIHEDTSDCKTNDESSVSISLPSSSVAASSDPVVPVFTSSPLTVPVSISPASTLASSHDSTPSHAHDVSASFALVSPRNTAEAKAHAALVGTLHSAGVVPTKDHEKLAHKLILECISDENDLQVGLRDAPELLASIGMKPGQQSRLTRYLNRPPAVTGETTAPPADPEAAALDSLKRFFEAACIVPASTYDTIALKLIEQGVADGISLRASLACNPPAFDLNTVVVRTIQASKIVEHLRKTQ
jgi:hypothetical protein